MAQYNFKGNIDDVTERQKEFIYKVIQELGFENSEVLFENVGIPGDNYVASIKRIKIEGDNGSLSIIAKIAPNIEMVRQAMKAECMFRNEHIMYTEVLPKLVQLQVQEDIPEKEQLKYAKCYGSLSEPPNEIILLEDLTTLNYTMLDRFVSLTDECIRSVLKNFALLHSLSYVLKYKEPETFNNFKDSLFDMWSAMATLDEMKFLFQGLRNDILNILEDPEHLKVVQHKIVDTLDIAAKLTKIDNDSKYAIIQQGDAWTNNIMFRFEDSVLADSIMIDYQLSRGSSPVTDIMYMIFNCTDYETRKQNFYDWIDHYHTELEKSLSNYGLKVNFVYPRDKLDADLKRYGRAIFGFCVLLASVLIRKSDDAAKVLEAIRNENGIDLESQSKEFNVSQLDSDSITRFKNRIVGLIDSFLEFGLL